VHHAPQAEQAVGAVAGAGGAPPVAAHRHALTDSDGDDQDDVEMADVAESASESDDVNDEADRAVDQPPLGYLDALADHAPRTTWTQPVQVKPSMFVGEQEIKFTAKEMRHKALTAKRSAKRKEQALPVPLAQMEPAARRLAWKKLQKEIKALNLLQGSAGMSCFADLSYFRYDGLDRLMG
jgi:hypothetical protein